MPISFYHEFEVQSFSINSKADQLKNLLNFIASKEAETPSDENEIFNISLQMETKFLKSSSKADLLVAYSKDPNAINIIHTEEQTLKRFPLNFKSLVTGLKLKYSDFKQDKKFNQIKKELENDPKLCHIRLLAPHNLSSPRTKYFSTEIFKEFDKYYHRK